MRVARTVEDLIGSTPLVELTALLGEGSGARVLGKLEAANPGGSAKDRVARAMVDAAEREGRLSPRRHHHRAHEWQHRRGTCHGGGRTRLHHLVLTMPDTMSVERRALAAAYGAEVVLTPGAEGMGRSGRPRRGARRDHPQLNHRRAV